MKLYGRRPPPNQQHGLMSTGGAHTTSLRDSQHIDNKPAGGKPIGMLVAVNSNKYPRPDFSKWLSYKSEPGQAKGQIISRNLHGGGVGMQGSGDYNMDDSDESMIVPEPIALLFNSLPKRSQYQGILILIYRSYVQC